MNYGTVIHQLREWLARPSRKSKGAAATTPVAKAPDPPPMDVHLKEWLESDRRNGKRAVPTADPTTATAEHAPARSKPALGQPHAKKLRLRRKCTQLQPRSTAPVAAPRAHHAAPPTVPPPGALDAPAAPALQKGGGGDQLPHRLQRIEVNQGKLVELAVAEYIKQNAGSVRAAAIKKYAKTNQHDQAFVSEAKRTYAERHHSTIVAAAATEYMEAHTDDEYFFGKAVDAYIAANKDSEELRDAAAEKYKGEMRENMRGDGRRT